MLRSGKQTFLERIAATFLKTTAGEAELKSVLPA